MNQNREISVPSAENRYVVPLEQNFAERIAQVKSIAAENCYCTLSTASATGKPWGSPVYFAYDGAFNFYWSSAIAALHSQNIAENQGRVALSIFNAQVLPGQGVAGIYGVGVAQVIESLAEATAALQLLFGRINRPLVKQPEDYLGASPRRFYRFVPRQVWVTGERLEAGNQLIDTKIEVDLQALIADSRNP